MSKDYYVHSVPIAKFRSIGHITEAQAERESQRAVYQTEFVEKMLSGSQAKTAFALRTNCERMMDGDLDSTVFMTLTIGDLDLSGSFRKVYSSAEASRRFNNLNRRVLSSMFERYIVVTERHKDKGIHFHVLGVLAGRPDIRTGFDFPEVEKRNYSSVSKRLLGIWERLRAVLPSYGFGRTETMPVRKTGPAIAAYVSKYIEKNVCNRLHEDKHKKLVRYGGWNKEQLKPNGFGWGGATASSWRLKTRALAGLVGVETTEQAYEAFGPRWAFHLSRIWSPIGKDDTYPGLLIGYGKRNRLRLELVRLNGSWARHQEEMRFDRGFFDEIIKEDPSFEEWFYREHNSDADLQASDNQCSTN